MRQNTIVLIYNSFQDSLFQNLLLQYLKTLSAKVHSDFYLITFEQREYAISPEDREKITQELKRYRIHWKPISFHTGRFLLLKKAWDTIQVFFLCCRLKGQFGIDTIVCFANVSAAIGVILKKCLNLRQIIYSYEPHSEFMADLGYWSRSGLKFKLLRFLENLAAREAELIMTGTKHMVDRLEAMGVRGRVFRAPTAVDDQVFYFDQAQRERVRTALGIGNESTFIYAGKFGGLYYEEEIGQLMREIYEMVDNAFFIIATINDHDVIRSQLLRSLPEHCFHLTYASSAEEMRGLLSASDLGIVAIPPTPSQRFRSPTKVAEYLLCGLPYITTRGVSEDDFVALENNVGIVIDNFSQGALATQKDVFELLLREDSSERRKRCREVGLVYRSKSHIDKLFADAFTEPESSE